MKYSLFLIILLSITSFGQEKDLAFFKKIKETALPLAKQISSGDIEIFKNAETLKRTWTYEKLKIYKDSLDKRVYISRGNFIMPSFTDKNLYTYCEYTLTEENQNYQYYYVVAIIINTEKDEFIIDNKYLFTENDALAMWWRSAFHFFESDLKKTVPIVYLHPDIPPPPPQGFLSKED